MLVAPAARLQEEKQAAVTTGTSRDNRPSLRNGLNGLYALSPVNGLSCHRHQRDAGRILADLAPASRRQDHAISPYANAPFVREL
jgi:hypothetical protein